MKKLKYIFPFLCLLTLLHFSGCHAQTPVEESLPVTEISPSLPAAETAETEEISTISYDQSCRFSNEYRSSKYYTRLMTALNKNENSSFMQRVLDTALSQEGYLAYSLENMIIEQVRDEGNLWTGAAARNGSNMTGNTEYTRWFEEYVLNGNNPYIDYEWCSIFVSWCLYQSGYHSDTDSNPQFYFSYCADPRNEDNDSLVQSFNLDQNKVWYTPTANAKLDDFKDFNTPVHTDTDPYNIQYNPGGLVFFSWDGSGSVFDHIGIVVSYDKKQHILTYIGGNDYSSVMINSIDFDTDTFDVQPVVKNSDRIMAYAEYTDNPPDTQWYRDEYDSHLRYFYDQNSNKHWYYIEHYYNPTE